MPDITIWKKANARRKSGKKKPDDFLRIMILAVSLTLFIVGSVLSVFFMFPDNDDALYLTIFCVIMLAMVAGLFFVRAGMSDFIVFIKEEGVLYRVLFMNSETGTRDVEKMIEGRETVIKRAKNVYGLSRVASKSSVQLCKIIKVKSIKEYKSNFRIRCILARVRKNRGKYTEAKQKAKTLRIIKNYRNMDSLIEEFRALEIE